MCEIKCPICGTKLEYDIGYDGDYFCEKCGSAKMFGSEELWQALTDSMKEHDLCHDALVERTKELDRTHKALDDAKKWLMKIGYLDMTEHGLGSEPMMTDWCKTVALHGLKEIETALEQKD